MSHGDERARVRGCDGCPAEPTEPGPVNRPGLAALRYRAGTWGTFLAEVLAALPRQEVVEGGRTLAPLARLNTQAPDDPAVALADACAVMADVLTFYQERIANEGFLSTAVERRSVLELARALGYELGPGVAASTPLAFTVEAAEATPIVPGTAPVPPAAPRTALVPRGTQVQSIPGPGEAPQTFETVEDLVAHAEWNELRPRRTQLQALRVQAGALELAGEGGARVTANRLWLEGTSTQVKPGDVVLAVAGGVPLAVPVLGVEVDEPRKRTVLRIGPGDTPAIPRLPPPPYPPPATTGRISSAPRALDARAVEEVILAEVWDEGSLAALCAVQRWDPAEVARLANAAVAARGAGSALHAFRQRLACFGHNAPPYAQVKLAEPPDPLVIAGVLRRFPSSTLASRAGAAVVADTISERLGGWRAGDPDDWDAHPRSVWEDSRGTPRGATTPFDLFLEREVERVVPGGWLLLERGATRRAWPVETVGARSLADFSLTGRATGLALDTRTTPKDPSLRVRETTAHVQSEPLALAPLPVVDAIEDRAPGGKVVAGAQVIELDRMVPGLAVGRTLLLTGTTLDDRDQPGPARSEAVRLGAVVHRGGFTTLYLAARLRHRYLRASLTLTANVALATHGQAVPREILGGGDGTAPNQRFTLQKPLTWTSAPTATGRESTLTVRVDDTRWDEVASLHGLGPDDRAYVVRAGDDGRSTVVFGDGRAGARLPTGASNVVASYRSGLGLAGQVPAGALSVLLSRPLGLRGVVNPLPADGAADPEPLDDARRNAPVAVLTLGRVVSLRDHEDFARAFAGVGKAQAVPLWDGATQLVHLTVAAADGTPLDPSSTLHRSLVAALRAASDGLARVRVDGFRQRSFRLEATVAVDPRADTTKVLEAAEAAVREAFSFRRRGFGQRVTSAEVMTVLQAVPGVVASQLSALVGLDAAGADQGGGVQAILPAAGARWEDGEVALAELLLVHPAGVRLAAGGPA